MIYPASTFLLATLVVHAASVFGAPIRIPASSQPIARALDSDPVLVERTAITIEKVPNSQRSVDPDPTEARSIHQREIVPEIATRNTAPSDEVEARDPLPAIEEIVRRYPRQSLYERHETRSPPSSPPEARSPSPEPESSPPGERRFFRRALYERHQPRAEPPTPPEARDPKPEEPKVRRFPRKILAEYYAEKRSPTPPPAPEPIVAREPEPEAQPAPEPDHDATSGKMVRRFARRGMAERVEARQTPDDTTPPPANPPAAVPSPPPTPVISSVNNASGATPTSSGVASVATPSSSQSPSPSSSGNPVVDIINANKAANFVGLPQNGLPVEVDREHETTVFHQKTTEHISQCGDKVTTPNTPVTPPGSPVVPPSSNPSGSSTPPVPSPVPQQGNGNTPPVPQQSNTGTTPPPVQQGGDGDPKPVTDGTTPPTPTPSSDPANASSASPSPLPVTSDATTPPPARRDGDGLADPIILRGRSLGYSGPAWASFLKRSVN